MVDELPGLCAVFPDTETGIREVCMRPSRRLTVEDCFMKRCPHLDFVQCSVRGNRICDLTGKGIGNFRVYPLEEDCAAK
jgi:hypothetical protein